MNGNFVLLNTELWLPIVLGALLLWFVFIWKEWSTSERKRLWSKIIVGFFTILALVMIALTPSIPEARLDRVGVLLTNGTNISRLDSLKKVYKNLKQIEYPPEESLSKELDSINTLFILGYGVPSFDFWQLTEKSNTYLGDEIPTGITRLKYQQNQKLGNELRVDGYYKKSKLGHRLVLEDPGGTGLDSVLLAGESKNFSLRTDLKVAGNYEYALTEKDTSGRVILREPLPVKVLENTELKVLIINSFPTFETKYLKNFLAEKRHQVLVRSQLTSAKYKFEYFNRERKPVYRLTQNSLEEFDVLIIDAVSYRNLSSKATSELMQSVREDGLGVFVQPDRTFFRQPKSSSYFSFEKIKNESLRLPKWSKSKVPIFPYSFKEELLVESIHSKNDICITAYRALGKGRIGTTVLQNTYQHKLDGRSTSYQNIWSEILEAISGSENLVNEWESAIFPIYKNQPYSFKIRTTIAQPKVTNGKSNSIPLRQDIDFPTIWSGITYPRNTGWGLLNQASDTINAHNFYVHDSGAWEALNAQQTREMNKRQFNGEAGRRNPKKLLVPISPIWFFIIFILGMGWLWLEPKLYG